MSFAADLWLVMLKDLRLEVRRFDGLSSMVFLAAVSAVVLALALGAQRAAAPVIGPGVLWVASLLSATVGLGRIWERERVLGGFRGLLLTPVNRSAIFLGKSAALFVLLVLTEVVLVPLTIVLFRLPITWELLLPLGIMIVLGCAGFAFVGILLGAIAVKARAGELLLGAVMYPLVVPLLIGGVKGTAALLEGGDAAALQPWVGLLLLSDAVFLIAGLWLFDALTTE
jgi:heme exporter protein CcmB